MSSPGKATARAYANIALAKYWGKADVEYNLPAVPSISMTLAPLTTTTTVRFDAGFTEDTLELDGQPARPGEVKRAQALLDRVRSEAQVTQFAAVSSVNDFPTAAGLASSASGFCALAAAARAAAGLGWDRGLISSLSRWSSASAGRSVYGGFVELPAGTPGDPWLSAKSLAGPEHWDLRIVVAVTAEGRKDVGSTDGMTHTRDTSPYYQAWVNAAPALCDQVREGIEKRDLRQVGEAMEHSTLAMHACAMAAAPAVIYFQPATLAVLHALRAFRRDSGVQVYATMDAGPHVKALCHADDVTRVEQMLAGVDGVRRTLVATPGPGVELIDG